MQTHSFSSAIQLPHDMHTLVLETCVDLWDPHW